MHAVSVGEVLSAVPVCQELRRRYPDLPLFLSTTTLAGRTLAEDRLPSLTDGIFYAPIDYQFAVRRVFRRLRPALFLNFETELWPHHLREAKRQGAAIAQINARISDRAWPRYQQLAWFFRAFLPDIDLLTAQSARDADRFRTLGYDKPIQQPGNLKFDFAPSGKAIPAEILLWLNAQSRPIWIAASTMPPTSTDDVDEDDAVLDAFTALAGSVALVLAPRKPERFDVVARKLEARGIPFARRSQLPGQSGVSLLLLDSIGELASLFSQAAVAFVGGTLNRRGGHNPLEPAYFGLPIITGPNMQNFAAIHDLFVEQQAVRVIASAAELPAAVRELVTSGQAQGQRAKSLAQSLRGATARTVDQLHPLLERAVPRGLPPLSGWLAPLSAPWIWVSRRQPSLRRLPVPVISIGNLSMGGTGKTPVTLALAAELHAAGHRVGILTRGYARQDRQNRILLPGEKASFAQTGDEVQLFLDPAQYAVAIGADRFGAGQRLLERFPATVLLLDDGFQHRRLDRDFDLVLVDCLQPFPGFAVPPQGRLREPLDALVRASAFGLTRRRQGLAHSGLRDLLAHYNPHAPAYFLEASEALAFPPPAGERLLAFCAIGNPAAFRLTLDRLGFAHVPLRIFPDHHRFTTADLSQLRALAGHFLTTAKDAVKLPPGFPCTVVRQSVRLPQELLDFLLRAAQTSS